MKKGFTLVEILVAVLIMGILVTMAVPQYEKAVEKSRLAEVRTTLKRLYDAKMRVLDNMEEEKYKSDSPQFGFENLDFSMACQSVGLPSNGHQVTCSTEDFVYVLNPSGANSNFVCAVRRKGDYRKVNFIYKGADATPNFECNEVGASGACDVFGMVSSGSAAFCSL